ncbi:MAG: hypothetical protein K2X55_17050 [Burkholderiaceae bacterium]|nr:hypothetical protein [Burkholderiaceae bacterium]
MKTVRLSILVVIAVCHFTALPGEATELNASSSSQIVDFEKTKLEMIEAAIAGCSKAIVEPAIHSYMKKANSLGDNLQSEEETRKVLESRPEWKTSFLPKILAICKCATGAMVAAIRDAQSERELDEISSNFFRSFAAADKNRESMVSCAKTEMTGLKNDLGK